MRRKVGDLPVRTHVIPNGVDLDKLTYREREKGFNIGYAGNIVPTKGILLMFHYFRYLLNKDDRYRLHLVGLNRFHGREGEYYNYYKNDLPIIEAGETNNINQWLEGVDFLWQPSLTESFSLIIGEAMAKGIKPLINDFYGSRELWPEELIYRDFSGFMKILQADYDSAKYRAWAEKYSLDKAVEKIKKEVLNDSR
jgi:glycosyltransferase involved in cell wall biosynthesis